MEHVISVPHPRKRQPFQLSKAFLVPQTARFMTFAQAHWVFISPVSSIEEPGGTEKTVAHRIDMIQWLLATKTTDIVHGILRGETRLDSNMPGWS